MAQLYTTGPAHMFVAFGAGGGSVTPPLYLGTCQEKPRIQLRPIYEDVKNDLSAGATFDKQFGLEEAFIAADLNRFNESTVALVQARNQLPIAAAIGRGAFPLGAVGTLMNTEGVAMTLWLQFPYAAKPAYAAGANAMVPGYRFAAVAAVGPDEIEPGTRVMRKLLMFHAIPLYNATTGGFLLYDFNVAGLPSPN